MYMYMYMHIVLSMARPNFECLVILEGLIYSLLIMYNDSVLLCQYKNIQRLTQSSMIQRKTSIDVRLGRLFPLV